LIMRGGTSACKKGTHPLESQKKELKPPLLRKGWNKKRLSQIPHPQKEEHPSGKELVAIQAVVWERKERTVDKRKNGSQKDPSGEKVSNYQVEELRRKWKKEKEAP